MKFLGIDFGWMRGASGVALLETDDGATTVTLMDVRALPDTGAVLAWIDEHVGPEESALIAVDAPTVIPAGVKMRQVDKLTHTHFGRLHGGAYPANLERPFAKSTTDFGRALVGRRYQHAAEITARHPGRYQIECFPHPAMLRLFSLPRILKYKKGRVEQRREELGRLRALVADQLTVREPRLVLPRGLPELPLKGGGVALKATEDQLDAVVCAYVGAHWWRWGAARNQVLGDAGNGYIVVPHAVVDCAEPPPPSRSPDAPTARHAPRR